MSPYLKIIFLNNYYAIGGEFCDGDRNLFILEGNHLYN